MILRPEQIELLRLGLPTTPCNDSGGSSAPAVTSQTVTQNAISPEQAPYFHDIMSRAQGVSVTPYQSYQGQRVAGLTPMEQEGHLAIANMQNDPAAMKAAQANMGTAAQRAYDTSNFDSHGIASDYQAAPTKMFNAPGSVQSDFNPSNFDGRTAAQYMSPYMNDVTSATLADMDRRHAIGNVAGDSSAASAGAFGGSRAALMKAQGDHDYNMEANSVIANGRQNAFTNAQQQFGADRAAQQAASGQRLQAGEFNVGSAMDYGKTGMQNQQFNESQRAQQALMAMQGQTANEASRVAAAGVQQRGAEELLQSAQAQAGLGSQQQDMALQRAQAQNAAGAQERGINQQSMDVASQEFANQRDAERNNLAFYASMMRGSTPSMINSATTNAQSPPSATAQALGLGIGALGAANAYNKIGG